MFKLCFWSSPFLYFNDTFDAIHKGPGRSIKSKYFHKLNVWKFLQPKRPYYFKIWQLKKFELNAYNEGM